MLATGNWFQLPKWFGEETNSNVVCGDKRLSHNLYTVAAEFLCLLLVLFRKRSEEKKIEQRRKTIKTTTTATTNVYRASE